MSAGRSGPAETGEQVDTADTGFDVKTCVNLCQSASPDRLKQVKKSIQVDTGDTGFDVKTCINLSRPVGPDRFCTPLWLLNSLRIYVVFFTKHNDNPCVFGTLSSTAVYGPIMKPDLNQP